MDSQREDTPSAKRPNIRPSSFGHALTIADQLAHFRVRNGLGPAVPAAGVNLVLFCVPERMYFPLGNRLVDRLAIAHERKSMCKSRKAKSARKTLLENNAANVWVTNTLSTRYL